VPRVITAVAKNKRRKRIFKKTEGFYGARKRCLQVAREAMRKAELYMTRDRKNFKREIRRLWITRVNAACHLRGTTYSRFVAALKKAGVGLNRKELSEIAIHDPSSFDQLVQSAVATVGQGA
jgi:large subunit ribosomal protein L20